MDQAVEDDRLARKVESGANVIYTQPVFSREAADSAVAAGERFGVPVLVGVLPLRSQRHAEFMHHEVPGISVPDDLRRAMAEAATDEEAQKVGLEAAQELSRAVAACAQGLYLMPPFGNPEVALRVMEAIR
jgi:homocysteine S-methyltransferase